MGFCLLRTPTAAGGGARGGSSGVCESEGWRLRCYKQVQWLWARFISWVMVHSSGIVLLHVAAWVSDVFHFVTQLSPDHCHCVCCWSKKWWSVLLPCRTLSWQEGERATGNVLRPPPPILGNATHQFCSYFIGKTLVTWPCLIAGKTWKDSLAGYHVYMDWLLHYRVSAKEKETMDFGACRQL